MHVENLVTPGGWNPHGYYLPHNAGPTQALNLADLGNGVPGLHGAGNVRLPQPQRKPATERETTARDGRAHKAQRTGSEDALRPVELHELSHP